MLTKSLLTLAAVSLVSFGFSDNRADYNYPARGTNYDSGCPAPKPEPVCPDDCRSSNQRIEDMQDRVITPDAGPRVCNGADVVITADFIYWKVREDGLGFVENGTLANGAAATLSASKGNVHQPNFNWEPGFKVGLGLGFAHDGWDLYAQYTWLRSDPSTRTLRGVPATDASFDASNVLRNLWAVGVGANALSVGTQLTFASANWDLHFNVIDAELGRNYYVSKFLTLRPFVGFKGTWQDSDYTVRYTQQPSTTEMAYRMRNNVDYWGFGIRAGTNNAWYFMRNFCLFGDWALTALWGEFDVLRRDFFTADTTNLDATVVTRNNYNEFYSVKAVLELAIGLRYDVWWGNDDYHFGFQAGWEEQIWFDQNQRFKPAEEGAHGDLVFQGLTIKVRFDF